MAKGAIRQFSDPESYAAAFGDARLKLTITGAGDFSARLTRLRSQHLEMYRCRESLPRIAYISLPTERVVLSFPIGSASPLFGGAALRNGDVMLHSRGDRMHQRSNGACQWGLVSLSAKQLAECSEALNGQPIVWPHENRVLRPTRSKALRFQHLFSQACGLADDERKLLVRPEVARSLEQEMLHAIVHCLAADDAADIVKMKPLYAALMVRFEELVAEHIDQKLNVPNLCAELDVAERTFRMYCAEFLGVSPTRYHLLQRLNRARSALQRANPATSSVAEIARKSQFLEFGRFAVTYRTIFGESPSVTLQRDPQR